MRLSRAAAVPYLAYLSTALALLAVGGVGYLAFIAFVKGVLLPQDFATYGLAFTSIAGATASFFSPCSFAVFPSLIAFAGPSPQGQGTNQVRQVLLRGSAAALGAATTTLAVGIVIGALGTSLGPTFSIFSSSPNSAVAKGLRITVGAFVLCMGLLNALNLSHRVPLVGRISTWAHQLGGASPLSLRSAYAYGAVYLLVGFG